MSNRLDKLGEPAFIRTGTFTPRFQDDSFTNKTEAYSIQQGNFTRIGNRVFFDIRLKINNSLGSMITSNALNIVQLPFAIGANSVGSTLMGQGVGLALPVVGQPVTIRFDPLTNSMRPMVLGLAAGHSSMTVAQLSTTGDIKFSGHYETDDA